MQHEKSDKPSDLQRKLEGLAQVPGEPAPDTAALWNRLERRLQPRPATRHRYFLWAAACVLLMAGPAAWFSYPSQTSRQVPVSTPVVVLPVTDSSNAGQVVAMPRKQGPAVQQKDITVKNNRKSHRVLPAADLHNLTVVAEPAVVVVPLVQELSLPVAAPATTPVGMAASAPVKKLKVVHLNELAKAAPPETPEPAVSLLATRAAPARPNGSRGNISFSRNTSDEIIKINLSPTN